MKRTGRMRFSKLLAVGTIGGVIFGCAVSSDATQSGWRYPRNDRIGHACLHQRSLVRTGNDWAVLKTLPSASSILYLQEKLYRTGGMR
jgi:hypothetical protein